ncbi:hypothetical protein [Actibacterium pelagium]|uniref:Uncharacterized protein n=1 Tax=Actibacterium pelagium TaxID=2029103 RepID=A0A917AFI3_9RHOB|nr:hypothetical protein [Actibacterium pelagium]GGE47540.1 hypothetical protein GCM10011517_14180 [Actibacterium pelagium]
MALINDLAEELARDAIALSKKTGDDEFPEELGMDIGRTSTTLEEAYMTALRLLRSAERARAVLAARGAQAASEDKR